MPVGLGSAIACSLILGLVAVRKYPPWPTWMSALMLGNFIFLVASFDCTMSGDVFGTDPWICVGIWYWLLSGLVFLGLRLVLTAEKRNGESGNLNDDMES